MNLQSWSGAEQWGIITAVVYAPVACTITHASSLNNQLELTLVMSAYTLSQQLYWSAMSGNDTQCMPRKAVDLDHSSWQPPMLDLCWYSSWMKVVFMKNLHVICTCNCYIDPGYNPDISVFGTDRVNLWCVTVCIVCWGTSVDELNQT